MNDETVAKLLYYALAYGSREQRIRAMLASKDQSVFMYSHMLQAKGYLTSTGVVVEPSEAGQPSTGEYQQPSRQ